MAKIFEDGTDIFQVLNAIKKHSGLLILRPQLDYLYNYINGYKLFASVTKTEIKNLDKFEQFPAFLRAELKEEYENTMGWFGYLHGTFGNEEGFRKFFEYLDKFKENNGYK